MSRQKYKNKPAQERKGYCGFNYCHEDRQYRLKIWNCLLQKLDSVRWLQHQCGQRFRSLASKSVQTLKGTVSVSSALLHLQTGINWHVALSKLLLKESFRFFEVGLDEVLHHSSVCYSPPVWSSSRICSARLKWMYCLATDSWGISPPRTSCWSTAALIGLYVLFCGS